jgi:uncharacterized SAM-binding protein YcdF (DUF218 family)
MFFILSKTLFYFIRPISLVVECLLLSFIVKNPLTKRNILIVGTAIIMVFGNVFISGHLQKYWEPDPVLIKNLGNYEYGIVLTGITDLSMEPRDRVYINYGADRVFHTILLYRLGKIRKILITGRNGLYAQNKQTEAEELKSVFMLSMIPEKDIVLETQAINTYENAVLSKKTLERKQAKGRFLLITSAFHMKQP